MSNKYDQAARFTVKIDPMGFLRWLVPAMDPDLRFVQWLDTRRLPFPGEPDRVCDTVAELAHASGTAPPWALVLEFESEPDAEMPKRLLEYAIQARRELRHGPHGRDKYGVAAAVVNLTGVGRSDALDMALPGASSLRLFWGTALRNMETEDAAATLAAIREGQQARSLLPWIPLMAGASEEGIITEWKRLAGLEPEERRRRIYAGLALIFADRAGRKEPWQKALEGWNVKEASIISEWQEEARVEKAREYLIRLLRAKFPNGLPAPLIEAINSQQSSQELSRWFDVALAAASLQQFQAILGLGDNSAPKG